MVVCGKERSTRLGPILIVYNTHMTTFVRFETQNGTDIKRTNITNLTNRSFFVVIFTMCSRYHIALRVSSARKNVFTRKISNMDTDIEIRHLRASVRSLYGNNLEPDDDWCHVPIHGPAQLGQLNERKQISGCRSRLEVCITRSAACNYLFTNKKLNFLK